MKKALLLLFTLSLPLLLAAQLTATSPAIITRDYTGEVELIYDASLGNGGLRDYTGNDVYAHTGVITTASSGDNDWKHAPAWKDNSPKYALQKLGDNKWKLIITPGISGYYNLAPGEVVTKLAFVFRNADGSKQGKDADDKDIFVPVLAPGLNVSIVNPSSDQVVGPGSVVAFTVNASPVARISLSINNQEVAVEEASTNLNYSHTFSQTGDFEIVASATASEKTVSDTLIVVVPGPTVEETMPAGVIPGINYVGPTSVTLVLHAPAKQRVAVIGEFNNWIPGNDYQLKKDGDFWWITLTELTPGYRYAYQYLVDGMLRISDPYTELVLDPWNDQWINHNVTRFPELKPYPAGKTEGLVATFVTNKEEYDWEVTDFQIHDRENLVIYELLLRDFTVDKSLEAAISKLDYLKELGITAIELMPVQEFDGNESWGYNPNHFFAPDKAYGTPEMYKRFVDECHKRGIAVLLDVVFNHATGVNPMAALYWNSQAGQTASDNPWFNVTAPHPYSVFHDFNHSYVPTRDFFKRVLQYWIQEYKIDGYRLDLTKGFTQKSSTEATASRYDQSRIDYLTEYYDAAKAIKPDVMFILEHFCEYSEELELANRGMYLWRNVNNAFSQAAMGYSSDSDFGGLNTNPRHWVGFSESHDEERNFFKAKSWGVGPVQTDSVYRISRVPLNIAFTVLVPGPKMLWQFQELGYDYSIDALGGRTSNKPSAWTWLGLAHRKSAMQTSAKLIHLRRMFPEAFAQGAIQLQTGAGSWENGRRIVLSHSSLNMVVLGNFKADKTALATAGFPKTGTWFNVLTGKSRQVTDVNEAITLQAGELMVFTDREIVYDFIDDDPEGPEDIPAYPTITGGAIKISSAGLSDDVRLFSTAGRLMASWRNLVNLDISHLPEGMYILRLSGVDGIKTVKLLKVP